MKNKKKVVLEIASMSGCYGIENFIMNVIRKFDHDLYRVDFVSSNTGPFDEEIESYGGTIYRLPSIQCVRERHIALLNLLRTHPEIVTVHIHGNTAIGCLDAYTVKKAGVKNIIVHSHSDDCEKIKQKILHYIFRKIIKKKITKRLCCSDAAGRWMFGKNAFYEVIPNAIDIKKYSFSSLIREKMRSKYGISSEKIIGHVGRVEKVKNHDFLLKIFKILNMKYPDTRLLIVGSGSYVKEFTEKIKELEIEDVIIWIQGTNRVYDYLQMMDVFVFPSLWEGLGISLLEAQASGLPCLVSDVIKQEVCITKLIHKKSLQENCDAWADDIWTLLNLDINRANEEYIKQLEEAGYNSSQMAKKVLSYYFDI